MKFIFQRFTLLSTVLLLLESCGGDKADDNKSKSKGPVAVSGFVVQQAANSNRITLPGQLLAMDEVVIMPEISGRVVKLYLPEGERVKKGTLLVKLFDDDLQAKLKKLQEQLKIAQSTQDRQKKLLDANGISQLEYDQTVSSVNSLQADVDEMNAEIEKTEIRAPFDGTIGLRNISEGAYVSAGTDIATIRSLDHIKIDFNVPEIYASIVKKGMTVQFRLDADSTLYNAEVMAGEKSVDQSALNYHVRALVHDAGTTLLPGTSASVEMPMTANDSALMIPSEALLAKGNSYTVAVSKNGSIKFVEVTTGPRTSSDVTILSGLSIGDTIATTGLQFIKDGSAVRFTNLK